MMTDNLSVIVKQGGEYKRYENCVIDNIYAHCNDCSFTISANGVCFLDWQFDMISAHVKSGHSTCITYNMRAEKVSDGGCPYGGTSTNRAISK